ncbi:MAG: Ig-like domain-containing protein [Myxococcaceae bacterium]
MLTRLFAAASVLLVTPALADVQRLGPPHYQPLRPASETSQWRAGSLSRGEDATDPTCYTAMGKPITCTADIQYFGGPVLSNAKVYAVLWSIAVSPDVALGVGGFYAAATNSEWVDWLTEYSTTLAAQVGSHQGQPGTQQVIGRGTFAGSYTLPGLSQAYPLCTPGGQLTCISDADIQSELDWQIRNGSLPVPDAHTVYMVHFPASVVISDPEAVSCKQYCAYHSSYLGTYQGGPAQNVAYAVVPDVGANGCENGCGPGTTFENTCLVASHELAESTTDTAIGLVSSVADYPLAWFNTVEATPSDTEIADLCDQHPDSVGENGLTGCTPSVDAGCYVIQQLFSEAVWNANVALQPNVAACVSSHFDTDDYSIALAPNTLTLLPGTTATAIPVVTTLTNGTPQSLTLTVTESPPGVDAGFDNASLSVGGVANLTVSAEPNAALLRDGVLVVRATGTATHSAALLVQLVASDNDWSLFLSPTAVVLLPGTSQTVTVGGLLTFGSAEPVSLSSAVAGLPPGVTASFSPSTLTPGASTALLTLTASPSAPGAAPSTMLVRGVSASQPLGHPATGVVQVNTPPTVSISTPTPGATLSGAVTVQVAAVPGANVALSRITIGIDNNAPLSSGSVTSVQWDTRATANGSHTINATVKDSDGATGSASINVTVSNAFSDFSFQVAPQSVLVPVGGSAQLTVTTTASGTAEPIALRFVALPGGVSASFSPALVTAGNASTVTLSATAGAPEAPSTAVTLVGTTPSQPMGHSAALTVSVGAASSGGGCASSGTASPSLGLLLLWAALFLRRRPSTKGL